MAEQLQCLGFDFDTPERLERFFADHWDKKTLVDLTDGVYVRMDVGPALACWLSVDAETQALLDWDIHADDGSRLPCAFAEQLPGDELGQSGLIRVTLDPGGAELPVTAACPVLAMWPEREEGAPGLVSLAFYAESLTDCGADRLTADPEDNMAVLSGAVLAAETCRNPWSSLYYRHITLSCLGQTLALYCPEDMLSELPAAGSRVSARCFVTCLAEAGVIS